MERGRVGRLVLGAWTVLGLLFLMAPLAVVFPLSFSSSSYLQFPLAAANAMILLAVVLMIIWGLTRLVDIRKEL